MDDLNMFHILADNVRQLGHGVQLSRQDDIASNTLVCFLDAKGNLHYGFAYKNGSNLVVICWKNGERKNKTVYKGSFVIAFHHEATDKGRNGAFEANDFNFPWLTEKATIVKKELEAVRDQRDELRDVIDRLAGLTIQQLQEVSKKIDEIQAH